VDSSKRAISGNPEPFAKALITVLSSMGAVELTHAISLTRLQPTGVDPAWRSLSVSLRPESNTMFPGTGEPDAGDHTAASCDHAEC
jgi:hypothetical protein